MTSRKKARFASVLALSAAFVAGAYVQHCMPPGETLVERTEQITDHAYRFVAKDPGSVADRFSEAMRRDITGYEPQVRRAVQHGLLSLPERQRAQALSVGLHSLPDSIAYRVISNPSGDAYR